MKFYRSRAPLRLGFAGGGTDVRSYFHEHGGCVLNAAIAQYAYTHIELVDIPEIKIHSQDYGSLCHFDLCEDLIFNGSSDLAKGVINHFYKGRKGLSVTTHNDAPPGSGLGSSSAMVVSLIGAFKELKNLSMNSYDIAQRAVIIEREELGIVGGLQDQYASAFGGFNFMEFHPDAVIVNQLKIDPWIINELEYNIVLAYTKKDRLSSNIIEKQEKNVKDANHGCLSAMHNLKQQAHDMKRALLTGNPDDFGSLLNDAWQEKKKMSDAISNPYIDELYESAIKSGALGGKVSGAGGGGFMMFYCNSRHKPSVIEAIEKAGATVFNCQFDHKGVQSWRSQRGVTTPQTVFESRTLVA